MTYNTMKLLIEIANSINIKLETVSDLARFNNNLKMMRG